MDSAAKPREEIHDVGRTGEARHCGIAQENEPRSGIEKESNPFLHRQPSLCRLDELLRISMND